MKALRPRAGGGSLEVTPWGHRGLSLDPASPRVEGGSEIFCTIGWCLSRHRASSGPWGPEEASGRGSASRTGTVTGGAPRNQQHVCVPASFLRVMYVPRGLILSGDRRIWPLSSCACHGGPQPGSEDLGI